MRSGPARLLGIALLLVSSGSVYAHTGHGSSGLFSGLLHPFGLDHLLAMLAVGLWSVSALPPGDAWRGPAAFMAALVVSATIGAAGISVPHLETLIAISVVMFGAMLIMSRMRLPANAGLLAIAVAASLHGLAHGAETPASGFAAYALGFLITTGSLHVAGVATGLGIRGYLGRRAPLALQALGLGCGGAGVYLLSHI